MCRGCGPDLFGAHSHEAIASHPLASLPPPQAHPVTVFSGGPIVTMDQRRAAAEAIAIADGRILAVGSLGDVTARAGSGAQRIDLGGRTLMPGIIDPHQHPVPGGLMLSHTLDVSYDRFKTRDGVLAALREQAAKTPPGEWIYASYFDNVLQGGYLHMADLDAISTQHPMFVYYVSMHTATGNALAFERAGVTQETGTIEGGGYFGRDAQGRLDGTIFEKNALMKFLIGLPKLTPELVAAALMKFLYRSAALGITMVHEAGALATQPGYFEGYKAMMARSPVRYSVSPMVDFLDLTNEFVAPYGKPGARALQIPGALLSFYAVKIVADGSPQQQTAYQSENYLNSSERGAGNFTPEQLNGLVQKVENAGWPVSIHCNGDASLEMALDAIEAAYGSSPPPTGINRIEHCAQATPKQQERMKRLGVQPSHLMNNVYYYGAAYRDEIFGEPRAGNFNPAGDFYRLGVPFSIHSDCPCSPVAPLREIGTAVTRRCSIDGSIVGEHQRVPIEAALRGMTVVAAAHCGLGQELGSLEEGKYADLAILEDDPRTADPDTLGSIKVSQTWVAGRPVEIPPG